MTFVTPMLRTPPQTFCSCIENPCMKFVTPMPRTPPQTVCSGMENPCMTFVTPTLLAGDRSLTNVVAHEIAHSWTGNLVTNTSWAHFWLNEGWVWPLQMRPKAYSFF